MGISLSKGGSVSLEKIAPTLKKVIVGLGWDPQDTEPAAAPAGDPDLDIKLEFDDAAPASATAPSSDAPFDLDASVFLLGSTGRVRSDKDFVFYNNLASPDGSVRHQGDNRTGEGEGDDERIEIDLDQVPAGVEKIRVSATIDQAQERKQNFGMVRSAFIRLVNRDTEEEVARYDLSRHTGPEAGMVFGELHRQGSGWEFQAVGQPVVGGLLELAQSCGVNVG